MNGDVLTDIDYRALLERHSASDAAATIATKVRHIQISLGVLRFDDDGDPTRLTGYDEKPAIDFTASMGVYCFAPRALSYIKPGERLDFPDLILRLIAAGEVVRAWPSDDYWLDIGRHDDYEQAQEEFESVRAAADPARALTLRRGRSRDARNDGLDVRLVHRRAERQRAVAVGHLAGARQTVGGREAAVSAEGVQGRIPGRLDAASSWSSVAEAVARGAVGEQHREGEVRGARDGLLVEAEPDAGNLREALAVRAHERAARLDVSVEPLPGGSSRAPRAARRGGS